MSEENLQVVRATSTHSQRVTHLRYSSWPTRTLSSPRFQRHRTPSPSTDTKAWCKAWLRRRDVWDDFSIELREMRDFDDHVLASLRWWGRGPGSGIQMEVDITLSSASVKPRSSACRCSRLSSRPSKPPGSRSRRCRRRTWSFIDVPSLPGTRRPRYLARVRGSRLGVRPTGTFPASSRSTEDPLGLRSSGRPSASHGRSSESRSWLYERPGGRS